MMTARRPNALIALGFALLALLVVACSSSDDGGSEDGASGSATATGTAVAAGDLNDLCGGDLAPCSRAEVDEAVLALESEYVDELLNRLGNGTYTDGLDWISAQPQVAEAEALDGLLMFRLEGGRPLFVVRPLNGPDSAVAAPHDPVEVLAAPRLDGAGTSVLPGAAAQSGAGQHSTISLNPPNQPSPLVGPARVVGEGTARDNPQNRKKAIFLTPYEWQGLSLFTASGPNPIQHLREIPDYNHESGDVSQVTNEAVTPRSFVGWRDYDAIFLETHGGGLGGHTFFATGVVQLFDRANAAPGEFRLTCDSLMAPYQAFPGVDCGIIEDDEDEYIAVGVTPVFFASQYGFTGLDAAIIYVGGCYSASNDDMARLLAGSTSAYVGWSALTYMSQETRTASLLVWLLVLHGRGETIGGALQTLYREGRSGGPDFGPSPGGASLGFYPAGDVEEKHLRLYAVPTLRDPSSTPGLDPGPGLMDGAQLKIEGAINDGIDDLVEIAVDLFGIIDPEDSGASTTESGEIAFQAGTAADRYDLSFFLDGQDIGRDNLGRKLNPTAEVFELGEGRYRYVFSAQLGFDVQQDHPELPLKVVVDLPEGGQSDYEVDVQLVGRESGAVISVGGQTWEFELASFVGAPCQVASDDSQLVTSGYVDGDFNATSFLAHLEPDGEDVKGLFSVHGITVKDEDTGAEWMADHLEFPSLAWLAAIPAGGSQIDEITIEDGRAFGTATFFNVEAAHQAWLNNGAAPAPVSGSFDIQCG